MDSDGRSVDIGITNEIGNENIRFGDHVQVSASESGVDVFADELVLHPEGTLT